ncbi:hypothetical protein LY90DRAFT_705133 [Neocallimastix californiae]|jgi:hypothetical protein|uniref:Uncharacterized protein n=1 Tax=Neocallimastix californiae TaxID=1754190 RepID=A0A1Y2BES6_9FUNG|nr:hypothetical protein LY90DRAFT_705133 [Neocallimastix californiae]|eukprot:ORY33342.1 hypothetical protein LY90DRAFT_705133 [Neocallimastix californiae]
MKLLNISILFVIFCSIQWGKAQSGTEDTRAIDGAKLRYYREKEIYCYNETGLFRWEKKELLESCGYDINYNRYICSHPTNKNKLIIFDFGSNKPKCNFSYVNSIEKVNVYSGDEVDGEIKYSKDLQAYDLVCNCINHSVKRFEFIMSDGCTFNGDYHDEDVKWGKKSL